MFTSYILLESSYILPMVISTVIRLGFYVDCWFHCKILLIDMMKTVCNRAYFGSLFVFKKKGPVYILIGPDCELVDSGC
jgi:hypothetical protein